MNKLKKICKEVSKILPYCFIHKKLQNQYKQDTLIKQNFTQNHPAMFEEGHFYSPVPSDMDISEHLEKFDINRPLPAINLNTEQQIQTYYLFKNYFKNFIWNDTKTENLKYFCDNGQYPRGCATSLYCFILHYKPKRIIEIGSGYSTSLVSDINKLYMDNTVEITSIEPWPTRLYETFGDNLDKEIKLIKTRLQDVSLELFDTLEENDLLIVDSTHISKLNSDVNKIIFEILPRLNKGVIVHFHDIFYPFEYPTQWIKENRAWNEDYLLRAFLMYNDKFSIEFWGTYLNYINVEDNMPNLGGNIFIKKK